MEETEKKEDPIPEDPEELEESENSVTEGSNETENSVAEVSEDPDSDDARIRAQSLKQAASLGNFGMFLILAVVIGYVIGRWLDGVFGTKPFFAVFWIVCGVISAILDLAKNIKKASKLGGKP